MKKGYRTAVERIEDLLTTRRRAYVGAFDNPLGRAVLKDLAKFCRADQSTFHQNERLASRLDGRREVWLRIQQHLQLDDEQLWVLFQGDKYDN